MSNKPTNKQIQNPVINAPAMPYLTHSERVGSRSALAAQPAQAALPAQGSLFTLPKGPNGKVLSFSSHGGRSRRTRRTRRSHRSRRSRR